MPSVKAKIQLLELNIALTEQEGQGLADILLIFLNSDTIAVDKDYLRQFAGHLRDNLLKYINKE